MDSRAVGQGRSCRRLPRWLRDGWTGLAAVVLPVECAGCRTEDTRLCGRCSVELAGSPAFVDRPPAPGCPPVAAVAAYRGHVRAVLVQWKDRGRHDLSTPLAGALAAAVGLVAASPHGAPGPGQGGLVLVPVPSSRRAVRRRGEDVVARLARGAAATLRAGGTPARVAPVLRHARRVVDQASLGAAERRDNLDGAFRVPWPDLVAGRTCVVVDDVATTGATLAEASRALAAAGAVVPAAAVVAATPRHPGPVTEPGCPSTPEWTSVPTWQASPPR